MLFQSLINNRYLFAQLVKRDVALRYRGTIFGALWALLNPLIMLTIFSFVFGRIFPPRWPGQPEGLPYWIVLYSGLIVFNLFAEAVSRSPGSVREYPNFVKKIVFPVTILPIVPLGAALFHGLLNLTVLAGFLAWKGSLSIGILLFPFLLGPLLFLVMGLSWFLAAWGVFIKDMTQIVPVFIQIFLFISPVFYSVEAVPESLRPLYRFNPVGVVIEACRAAVLGAAIPWKFWAVAMMLGAMTAALGYIFFQHNREEFIDAL